jgi:hypothetical protein
MGIHLGSQPPPKYLKPQRIEQEVQIREKVKEKLSSVLRKRYIGKGTVHSLTSYFAVPKGTEDIRMVYDASASGLNEVLWAPGFTLPSASSLLDLLTVDSWMSDLDMGEQFLNFPLHPTLQKFCGIDLRPYFGSLTDPTMWYRWTRCMMGLKTSPYFSIQGTLLGEEVAFGDPMEVSNPMHWSEVQLNLPGSDNYDPKHPWVSRITSTGRMAGAIPRYVDDMRPVGHSEEHCWQVTHRATSMFSYLGLQVTARKTRPPSPQPGPWAGTIAFAHPEGIGVTCMPEKWLKGKTLLNDLTMELQTNEHLQHKSLEKFRGFFIHLARTYPVITPFLKGVHLTLDGWRPHRDAEMWKQPHHEWDESSLLHASSSAPDRVTPAPRLADDIQCLQALLQPMRPPIRMIRASKRFVAVYGFVDASAAGFGSSFTLPCGAVLFRHGLWGRDSDSLSSNFRELANLVDAIEEGVQSSELDHAELFIYTDNTTAEGAYYRGNSSNRLLFQLVLRLHLLEMQASLQLHIVHIAGTRMIVQGTDGLSRGLVFNRAFSHSHDASFRVPLHLSALDRSPPPPLLAWVRSWCPDPFINPLSPAEWFTLGHGRAGFTLNIDGIKVPQESTGHWLLWVPPPAAARTALDELAISRHKRPWINHVFACSRLFTSQWRRPSYKLADFIFEVPAGTRPFWPSSMHEPLTNSFWTWARPCAHCGRPCRPLNGVFCANFATPRMHWSPCKNVWHGKCYTPHPTDHFYHHVETDDDGFDWRPDSDLTRHQEARDGDNLTTPFQCDLCSFRNLQQRDPNPTLAQDTLLLCCIRRANLDAVWGRESQTVSATLRSAKQLIRLWEKAGLAPQFPPPPPGAFSGAGFVRVRSGSSHAIEKPGTRTVQYNIPTIRNHKEAACILLKYIHGIG